MEIEDQHRHDGAQLDDDEKQGQKVVRHLQLHELVDEDHVPGGRDGQPFVMPSTMPTRSAFKASKIIVLKSPYRKQADRKIVPDTPSPAPRKQKGNMSARRNGPNSIPARTEQAAKKPHAPLRDRTDRRARTLARSPLRACRRTLACSLRPYPPPKGSRAGENASCCC